MDAESQPIFSRLGRAEKIAGVVLLLAFALPAVTAVLALAAAQGLEVRAQAMDDRPDTLLLSADVRLNTLQAAEALQRFEADRDASAGEDVHRGLGAARSDLARMRALPGGPGAEAAIAGLTAAFERYATELERQWAAAAGGRAPAGSVVADWRRVAAVDRAAAHVDAVQRNLMEQRSSAALEITRTWDRRIYAALVASVLLAAAGVLALLSEIRKRRKEKASLQRQHNVQLAEAEHLATLGEIAAGLAHEIRNPLGGIAAALEIIAPSIGPAEERQAAAEMQQQVTRIQRVIEELLHYARPQPLRLVPCDLNATVLAAAQFLRLQAHTQPIEVTFEAGELPPVVHDPEQMHRVVTNLGLNALHAIHGGGRIAIATWFDAARGMAGFDVRDNGAGIAAGDLDKIFRPFYSTKRGHGTGLGLSLCRRITELHGGSIRVRSKLGEGSVFTVTLQAAAQRGTARAAGGGNEG